jgi:imidazolonepropionase
LIRGARQLLTLRGPKEPRRGSALQELGIIHDGSLLIRDGILIEAGLTRRIENLALARNATEISAAGRVVMPGFVDSHTHLIFPPAGLFPPDVEASAHTVHTTASFRLETRARLQLEAMARHGTTTVEVKTGCGLDDKAEWKVLRVLAALRKEPVDVVTTYLLRPPLPGAEEATRIAECLDRACQEFLPAVRRRRLARFADLVWHDQVDEPLPFLRFAETARQLGFGSKVHAEGAGASAALAFALDTGAISIDHLEAANADDARRLGASGIIATLLPGVSFHRDGRYAPAKALIEAGAAVALATNFNSSHTPTLNMQTVVKLACLRMGLTPAEAISASTINGAHALGCADRVGSLEPGKLADLLILNISDYRELAHHFGMNLVRTAIKRGEVIYEEAEVAPRVPKDVRPAW